MNTTAPQIGKGLLVTVCATGLSLLLFGYLAAQDISMIYLLGVTFAAAYFGKREAVFTSVLSIFAMDFFFIPPRFSFAVAHVESVVTFFVMLIVGMIIGGLTERIRQQALLVSDKEHKVERERLLNGLLSSVSHDFRTPLATITGAVSAVIDKDTVQEAKSRELLYLIREQSERLTRIVRNVLDLARLGSDQLRLKREWQSLEELVGVALEHSVPVLGDRRVTVNLTDSLPLLKVDGVLFEQLIVNILENAGRHTPPETDIEIRGFLIPEGAALEIEDSGPGIPEEIEDRIFTDKLRQTPGPSQGMGIGLSICHAIVTAHQGAIRSYRGKKGGAVIQIVMPVESKEEATAV